MNGPTPPHARPQPLRAGLRLLLPLVAVAALLLLAAALIGAGTRWLLATESGSRWLLQRLPGVSVQDFRGALLGDRWQLGTLQVRWGTARESVRIDDLRVEGLRWQWHPHAGAWFGLQIERASASRVAVVTGPAGPRPIRLPGSIAPPVDASVAHAQVAELSIDGEPVLHRLSADSVRFDPRRDARYRAQALAFEGFGVAVTGDAALGTRAPLALAARLAVRPLADADTPRWGAVLQFGGDLQRLAVHGTLRGRAVGNRPAPTLDVDATLQPLQRWVLAGLKAQTESLDLQALHPRAPVTRLSGEAELSGGAGGSPLVVKAHLQNTLPGRWDQGRLPARQLSLSADGRLDTPGRIELGAFSLQLAGDGDAAAGRWTGSGVWQDHALTLDTRLDALAPKLLDDRAAAMTLTGPARLRLNGLPSPDWRQAASPPPFSAAWELDLNGTLAGAPQSVQVRLKGSADAQQVELTEARAQAGAAVVELKARLRRAGAEWALDTAGTLRDFNPARWWSDALGPGWQKSPSRLSGNWRLDARLPADARSLPPIELAQRLAGNGELHVLDSVLAGVPVGIDVRLSSPRSDGQPGGAFDADARIGGNQLTIGGLGNPAGNGAADRWRLELKAGDLSTLAPLFRLHPALAGWAPREGSANGVVTADGRWPALRTEGSLRVLQAAAGAATLRSGSATWRVNLGGAQPLSLKAELDGLGWGERRAQHLRAEIEGTLAEHHIDMSGAAPVSPGAGVAQALGIVPSPGTRALLRAQGRWQPTPDGGGRWNARIERLVLGAWAGGVDTAPPTEGWLVTEGVEAELAFGKDGSLLSAHAEPGTARLARALTVRWDDADVDLRPALPSLRLRADIEAFAVAPFLSRAQPGTGWGGDLQMAARLDIRAAEKLDAEVVLERRGGDLLVRSGDSAQALGLSEVRLLLSAHDGVWNFTPVFHGSTLGDIGGQLRVASTPERRWPQPDAPIDGMVEARVADIGIWRTWVPPGWRLAGQLQTRARVGGRFGDPQFTGELTGSGLGVRNLLQGVNVSDGEIAVSLQGTRATIERFTLRGGDGSLGVSGSGSLGASPQALLKIHAERFRVLGRVDRQIVASGDAELKLSPALARLDGRLAIDEGLFDLTRADAPSLDDDVTVRSAADAEAATAAAADAAAPRRNFALELTIDLGQQLRIRGRGLETALRGEVRLTTPGQRLAVNGSIRTVGGTYAAYNQKLEIDRGIVAFDGPVNNPRLDVLALRPNIDMRVGVQITGSLLAPRVRLFSEPEMSENDKLSWLVLGRAPDELGRNDTALLQRAAMALLAGDGQAPTDTLMRKLGIDELSLRQSDGEVRETVIALGKQLSRRWYLGYERGVNAATGTWQLIYRVAQRFTVRAQSGVDNSLDLIWTWRFQESPTDPGVRKSIVVPP